MRCTPPLHRRACAPRPSCCALWTGWRCGSCAPGLRRGARPPARARRGAPRWRASCRGGRAGRGHSSPCLPGRTPAQSQRLLPWSLLIMCGCALAQQSAQHQIDWPPCLACCAARRWQQQRLRAAFQQWQGALAERKAAVDNLRRCLIRKRLAFKLFRNWYWDSFDDEMQVGRRAAAPPARGAAELCGGWVWRAGGWAEVQSRSSRRGAGAARALPRCCRRRCARCLRSPARRRLTRCPPAWAPPSPRSSGGQPPAGQVVPAGT